MRRSASVVYLSTAIADASTAGGSHFCLLQLVDRQAAAVPAAAQAVQELPILLSRSAFDAQTGTWWVRVQCSTGTSILGPCLSTGLPTSVITR